MAANPHDLVPLLLEPPEGPLRPQQLAALEGLGLGLEHSLQDGPLSRQVRRRGAGGGRALARGP